VSEFIRTQTAATTNTVLAQAPINQGYRFFQARPCDATVNPVGWHNGEIKRPSNSNHSRYGTGEAVEKLKLEYAL